MIAAAEQAGEAGDRDLHFALLWLVATRAWWADPGPAARRILVEAASRLGDADDLHVLAIQAYADPFGHAPAVLARVQQAAAERGHDTEALLYLGTAAVAVGAFDVGDTLLSAGDRSAARRRTARAPGIRALRPRDRGNATRRLGRRNPGRSRRQVAWRPSSASRSGRRQRTPSSRRSQGCAVTRTRPSRRRQRPSGSQLPTGANMHRRLGAVREGLRRARSIQTRRRLQGRRAPLRPHRPGPSSCDGLVDHRRPRRGRPPRRPRRGGTSARGADRSGRRRQPDCLDRAGFATRPRAARRRRASRRNASRRHWAPTSAAGPSSAPGSCSLTASGYAASVGSPSRAHRCARPVTRSTRLAAPRSANRHAASCAHQGSRAGGATPPPATN